MKTNDKQRLWSREHYYRYREDILRKIHEHPENHRKCSMRSYRKVRIKILELLGSKCVICGFSDIRALDIDHVNGGGCREVKNYKHGKGMRAYYKDILKKILFGSKDYQLLCANCNRIKKYTNKEGVKYV